MSDYVEHEGELFVTIKRCGIDPLITVIDGFTVYHFPEDKKGYYKAQECLDWFRKEISYGAVHEEYPAKELDGYRENIKILERNIALAKGE